MSQAWSLRTEAVLNDTSQPRWRTRDPPSAPDGTYGHEAPTRTRPSRRARAAEKRHYWYQETPVGIEDEWSRRPHARLSQTVP